MITFAIMALLIGGFAINADAQGRNRNRNGSQQTPTFAGTTDVVLKEYEGFVEKSAEYLEKTFGKEGDYNKYAGTLESYLTQAKNHKAKLEKNKNSFSQTQTDRFNRASERLYVIISEWKYGEDKHNPSSDQSASSKTSKEVPRKAKKH